MPYADPRETFLQAGPNRSAPWGREPPILHRDASLCGPPVLGFGGWVLGFGFWGSGSRVWGVGFGF